MSENRPWGLFYVKFRLTYSDMNICFLYFFDFHREDQDNDKNSDDENEGKFFRTFAENLSHLVDLQPLVTTIVKPNNIRAE